MILISVQNLLFGSIDYLLAIRFPSGNFPAESNFFVFPLLLVLHSVGYVCSSVESVGDDSQDSLVHFCHGATGAALLLAHAVTVCAEMEHITADEHARQWRQRKERYLKSAKKAADVVWQRGLLKKGALAAVDLILSCMQGWELVTA